MATAWMTQARRRAAAWSRPEREQAMRHDQREAYVAWVRQLPWDWFATWTLPAGATLSHFDRAHRRWSGRMQTEVGRQLRQFLAVEYQQNGTPHGHALVYGCAGFDQFRAMRFWEEISGGFARIYVYDPARGAAAYCAKYVTKRTDTELRIIGPWPRYDPRRQLELGDEP
jgi:hypothetical protein